MKRCSALALALACLFVGPVSAQGPVGYPPSWESRLIYFRSFDAVDGAADIDREKMEERTAPKLQPHGILGRGAGGPASPPLTLRSPRLSPHLPLTVSFWWALAEDGKVDSTFGLFHLTNGRAIVSHFSRGKGRWCALDRPAGILQVYYLPGVRDVNGIYDRAWDQHLDLHAHAWHHTALVFQAASLIELYTDGKPVYNIRVRGREFRASDNFHELTLGTRFGSHPVLIDEVAILDRPLLPHEISECALAGRQMHQAGY